MSSDPDEPTEDLSGVESVLRAFTQIRQDTTDLILVLETQQKRKKKVPPPDTNSTPGSEI